MGRVPALDGLRGIAVMLVIAGHAWEEPAGAGFGVDIFFVLSGFLITSLLLDEHARTGAISLARFYMRRALRIAPALWLLIAVGSLLAATDAVAGAETMGPYYSIKAAYIGNLLMGYRAHSGLPEEFGHFWSLAFEEQFYLVWPFVLVVLLRGRVALRWIVGGLLVLAVASDVDELKVWMQGATVFRMWMAPDTHLAPLTIGCVSAFIYAHRLLPDRLLSRLWPSAALVSAAAIAFYPYSSALHDTPYLAFPVACAVVMLAVVVQVSAARAVLELRPLRAVGRVSYGLYLWHLPMIALFGPWPGIPIAVGATVVSYRFFELPLLRLKDRFRVRSTAAAAPIEASAVPVT